MKKSINLSMMNLSLTFFINFCIIMYFSSYSLLSMWMLMELSTFLFFSMSLMNKTFYNNIMIIFIIQSLSTILFLYSIIFTMSYKYFSSNSLLLMFNISMFQYFPLLLDMNL